MKYIALSLVLSLCLLAGCASNSPDPIVVYPDPATVAPDAKPKVDIKDAAYVEVVRGGFESGERFMLEFKKDGSGRFGMLLSSGKLCWADFQEESGSRFLEAIGWLNLVKSDDAYRDRVFYMDGTHEHFYVRTHSGDRYVYSLHNAPDEDFNWLWSWLIDSSRAFAGEYTTSVTAIDRPSFATSKELEAYREELFKRRQSEASGK